MVRYHAMSPHVNAQSTPGVRNPQVLLPFFDRHKCHKRRSPCQVAAAETSLEAFLRFFFVLGVLESTFLTLQGWAKSGGIL